MKEFLFAISLVVSLLTFSGNAQNSRWRLMKNQKLVSFTVDCALRETFPKQQLGKIVRQAIPAEQRQDPLTFQDLAFTMKLQKNGPTVYFVPTVCGASGNCRWLLYTINPLKHLGNILAQSIYTYESSRGMPMIITYGHISGFEGDLSTYVFTKGKYRSLGDEYHIDTERQDGNRLPRFLETAKRQCSE